MDYSLPVDIRAEKRKNAHLAGLIVAARPAPIPRAADLRPALARRADAVPDGPEWLHEVERAGLRIMAHKRGREVCFIGARADDWTADLAGLTPALLGVHADEVILDGEVVTPGGGRQREALRRELAGAGRGFELVAFDLLYLDGWDLREATLVDRKGLLREVVLRGGGGVRYVEHVVGGGPRFYQRNCRLGCSGVVSKRAASRYPSGAHRDWLIVECARERG